MAKLDKNLKYNNDVWEKSPISGHEQVLVDYDDKIGESRMDLSTGFYTNEYPLNHKKYPDFKIEEYEKSMPKVIKSWRYDDGEKYWYPSTLRTPEAMVFPVGDIENLKWCYAPVAPLKPEEVMGSSKIVSFESKLDMEKAQYFDRYLDAIKKIKGYNLGDITS